MLPLMCSKLAMRLFSHRWWFLLVSVAGFGGLAAILTYAPIGMDVFAGALAGPFILVPWGFLCLCIWFHPEHGNLQPGSRFVGRLPWWVQSTVRWYSSILLIIFLLVGLIIWPLFALTTA